MRVEDRGHRGGVRVRREGHVSNARTNESSGFDEVDQAALGVARAMAFVPAVKAEGGERCAIPTWVSPDVTFSVDME